MFKWSDTVKEEDSKVKLYKKIYKKKDTRDTAATWMALQKKEMKDSTHPRGADEEEGGLFH